MKDESIIGKQLKYKDNANAAPVTIIKNDNGWIELDNNSYVQEGKINELFVEYNKDKAPDPDMFVGGSSSALEVLAQKYQQIRQQGGTGRVTVGSPDMGGGHDAPPVEEIVDSRVAQPNEIQNYNMPKPPKSQAQLQDEQNREWARLQGMIVEDDGGPVTEINTDDWQQGNYVPGSMVAVNTNNAQFGNVANPQQAAAKNPAASLFENMKRSHLVKLKLEVEEMIPKLESIRYFDDMFEFSIVEHLAKEITNRFLRNPKSLEAVVQKQLEAIINPTKKKPAKKKPVAKPVAKKKAVKSESENESE